MKAVCCRKLTAIARRNNAALHHTVQCSPIQRQTASSAPHNGDSATEDKSERTTASKWIIKEKKRKLKKKNPLGVLARHKRVIVRDKNTFVMDPEDL